MKKANKKSNKGAKTNSIKIGEGTFHFPNKDVYEGNYVVIGDKEIYRQDYGIYKTNDRDEYRASWNRDRIGSSVHVVYGNKAEYRGEIDNEGSMSGRGIYVFPDGSSLSAVWKDNEPVAEHEYTDPLGYKWLGKLTSDKREIVFSPENNIWNLHASN